jgi:hypothetical protein
MVASGLSFFSAIQKRLLSFAMLSWLLQRMLLPHFHPLNQCIPANASVTSSSQAGKTVQTDSALELSLGMHLPSHLSLLDGTPIMHGYITM